MRRSIFNPYGSISRRFATSRLTCGQLKIPFDTKKFNDELTLNEFNKKQASTIVKVISLSINSGIKSIINDLVTKETMSTLSYKQKVDFVKLKGELQTVDKSEYLNLTNDNDRIRLDLEKLRQKLKEEISKTQASVRLDLSLEKGRMKEESSMHDLHIKETDTRIDQELSNMKMQIDSVKTQVMQWLIGVCTGTFALILAYVRLVT